jgi:hypothetical protein
MGSSSLSYSFAPLPSMARPASAAESLRQNPSAGNTPATTLDPRRRRPSIASPAGRPPAQTTQHRPQGPSTPDADDPASQALRGDPRRRRPSIARRGGRYPLGSIRCRPQGGSIPPRADPRSPEGGGDTPYFATEMGTSTPGGATGQSATAGRLRAPPGRPRGPRWPGAASRRSAAGRRPPPLPALPPSRGSRPRRPGVSRSARAGVRSGRRPARGAPSGAPQKLKYGCMDPIVSSFCNVARSQGDRTSRRPSTTAPPPHEAPTCDTHRADLDLGSTLNRSARPERPAGRWLEPPRSLE